MPLALRPSSQGRASSSFIYGHHTVTVCELHGHPQGVVKLRPVLLAHSRTPSALYRAWLIVAVVEIR